MHALSPNSLPIAGQRSKQVWQVVGLWRYHVSMFFVMSRNILPVMPSAFPYHDVIILHIVAFTAIFSYLKLFLIQEFKPEIVDIIVHYFDWSSQLLQRPLCFEEKYWYLNDNINGVLLKILYRTSKEISEKFFLRILQTYDHTWKWWHARMSFPVYFTITDTICSYCPWTSKYIYDYLCENSNSMTIFQNEGIRECPFFTIPDINYGSYWPQAQHFDAHFRFSTSEDVSVFCANSVPSTLVSDGNTLG